MLLALACSMLSTAHAQFEIKRPRPDTKVQPLPQQEIAPVERPRQFLRQYRPQLVESGGLVRAAQARSTYNVNGAGLTVAVFDTGLRTTHADFAGRIPTQRNYTADNGGNINDASDGQGHGTNVSGIIAANNVHVGIAPGANIIPIKVLGNDGSGSFLAVEQALQWVIDNRAAYNISVVNMSLGAFSNYITYSSDSVGAKIQTLRNAGVAVVVATGNDFYRHNSAQGMSYPAIFPQTVSAGAVFDANIGSVGYWDGALANTTGPDRLTPFSQRLHSNVSAIYRTDIFAPGASLTSSGIISDTSSSTMDGTSQATPVVAGVILLMQQYHKQQYGTLPTVDQIENALRASAVIINDGDDEDDNVTNTGLNYPRVDALTALQAIGAPITRPTNNDFANAQVIAGDNSSTTGTNQNANKEANEPNHAGAPGGASVWYKWSPTGPGFSRITTQGSSFDTLLAVYTSNGTTLNLIVQNDDAGSRTSAVEFNAVGGTTYYIAVDGYNGESGNITLNWQRTVAPLGYSIGGVIKTGNGAPVANVMIALIDERRRAVLLWQSATGTVFGAAKPQWIHFRADRLERRVGKCRRAGRRLLSKSGINHRRTSHRPRRVRATGRAGHMQG
jgi:subtilisin family serine protease